MRKSLELRSDFVAAELFGSYLGTFDVQLPVDLAIIENQQGRKYVADNRRLLAREYRDYFRSLAKTDLPGWQAVAFLAAREGIRLPKGPYNYRFILDIEQD